MCVISVASFSDWMKHIYFIAVISFEPVIHDWCNKGRGMSYPVCWMMHIKEPLLLIGKISHVTAAGFLSRYLSGPLPYVLSALLNKTCPSSLPYSSDGRTPGGCHG